MGKPAAPANPVCTICQNTGRAWSGRKLDRLPHTLQFVGLSGEFAHMRCVYEKIAEKLNAERRTNAPP